MNPASTMHGDERFFVGQEGRLAMKITRVNVKITAKAKSSESGERSGRQRVAVKIHSFAVWFDGNRSHRRFRHVRLGWRHGVGAISEHLPRHVSGYANTKRAGTH